MYAWDDVVVTEGVELEGAMRRVEVHPGELMTMDEADLDADGSRLVEFVDVVKVI